MPFTHPMLFDLLLLFTILYVVQITIFAVGSHNAHYAHDRSRQWNVSIIVAARNEEEVIRPCLDSLAQLTYPQEKLEIIIVNDRSTDRTAGIIQEYVDRFPTFRLLNAVEDAAAVIKGKTNAVAQAIDVSSGEILLFTDADCVVPKQWVEETVKYYNDDSVGVVAGYTSLRSKTLFEAIQALDWFVLFSIASATIRLHFPVTAVGNNLSVRRKAYDAVGGYRKIPFSITEDYALFHAVTSVGKYKARFPLDDGTLVQSLPCEDWKSLYRQKKRWLTGGADMDFKSISLFAVGFAFKLLLMLNFFAFGFLAVVLPFALKCLSDFLLVRPALRTFRKQHLLLYLLPFEVYYIAYVLLFPPIVLLNRKVHWKDRKFA
ncbi:MAG: glycosyltransferase [Ignavibacteriae bacterium]|nr:glycosyltransferase [Ignavibacteriota bacterium]